MSSMVKLFCPKSLKRPFKSMKKEYFKSNQTLTLKLKIWWTTLMKENQQRNLWIRTKLTKLLSKSRLWNQKSKPWLSIKSEKRYMVVKKRLRINLARPVSYSINILNKLAREELTSWLKSNSMSIIKKLKHTYKVDLKITTSSVPSMVWMNLELLLHSSQTFLWTHLQAKTSRSIVCYSIVSSLCSVSFQASLKTSMQPPTSSARHSTAVLTT